ncbi:MAG: hypothetical protein ACRD0S_05520, partial [Acidimicrobiales bacterium]
MARRFGVLVASLVMAQTVEAGAAPAATAAAPAPARRSVPPIESPPRAPQPALDERSFATPTVPTGAEPRPGRAAPPSAPEAPGAGHRAGEEVVERRTERSKTFATATPDRFKTQLFGGPVHYRSPQTGQWADIATTLVDAAPGRVRNGAGPVSVDLARDQARGPLARVGLDDDHSVAFALPGAAPGRARVEDNRVTYAGVRPQVDL